MLEMFFFFFGHAATSILDRSHGNDGSFYARLFVYVPL